MAIFFHEIKDVCTIVDDLKKYCDDKNYNYKETKEIAFSLSVSKSNSVEDSLSRNESISGISIQENDWELQFQKDRMVFTMQRIFDDDKIRNYSRIFTDFISLILKEEKNISIENYSAGILCEFGSRAGQDKWSPLFNSHSKYLLDRYRECRELWHFFTGMYIEDDKSNRVLENIKIRFFKEKGEKKVVSEIYYTLSVRNFEGIEPFLFLVMKCKQTLFDIIDKDSFCEKE